MEKNLKLMQDAMLESAKVFAKLCEEHHLRYYMAAGTFLGAVRHHGFIPWDDDMDFYMPRKDYQKFLAIKDLPKNFYINHYKTSNKFINSPIKFENTSYKIERAIFGNTEEWNLFIDIQPLDGYPDNKLKAFIFKIRLKIAKLRIRFARLQIHDKNNDMKKNRGALEKIIYNFDKIIPISKLFNFKKQMEHLDKILMKNDFDKTQKIIFGDSSYSLLKELYDRELFKDPVLYDFEDTKFYGVKNYDLYLTQLYGDYQKLPPIEEQKGKHNIKIRKVKENESQN